MSVSAQICQWSVATARARPDTCLHLSLSLNLGKTRILHILKRVSSWNAVLSQGLHEVKPGQACYPFLCCVYRSIESEERRRNQDLIRWSRV